MVFERAADEFGQRTRGIVGVNDAAFAAEGEEIGRAAEVHHAGDAAALVQVLAEVSLQLLHAAGDAEHADEVAAGGDAKDGDLVGVEVVFLSMGAQPADGGLAVMDLRGPPGLVGEAVVEAGPGVGSAFSDESHQHARLLLAASLPAAAVDVHDERVRFARRGLREVEVEHLARIAGAHVVEVPHGAKPRRGRRSLLALGQEREAEC